MLFTFKSLISGAYVCSPSEFTPDIRKTICISGHREKSIVPFMNNPDFKDATVNAVKLLLYKFIDVAVECGYNHFISGLAVGTDLWAADYILRKKKSDSSISLIGAMPYLRHAELFPSSYRELLRKTELGADRLICVNSNPDIIFSRKGKGSELYRDRNYFMVDNASAVIAFFNSGENFSGTAQTLNYARKQNKKICRFGLDDVYSLMKSASTDTDDIWRNTAIIEELYRILA